MKIIKAEVKSYIEIETDEAEMPCCRRFGPNKWLYLSGLSWEEPGDVEELEQEYQEFIAARDGAIIFRPTKNEYLKETRQCPECGSNFILTQPVNHSEYTPMGLCEKCSKVWGQGWTSLFEILLNTADDGLKENLRRAAL